MIEIQRIALGTDAAPMVPAGPRRPWMDKTTDNHAYRCLPLSMANSSGWELLCPRGFGAEWNGGREAGDVVVSQDGGEGALFAESHFATGIVTLVTNQIIRTPPGWGLWVTGPSNYPKNGIYAMSALVETDWLPYSFTMNWIFTQPGRVRFEEGEPFCFMFPVQHRLVDEVRIRDTCLDADPEFKTQHLAFLRDREENTARLAAGTGDAWRRHYFSGRIPGHPDFVPPAGHTVKRRVCPVTGAT